MDPTNSKIVALNNISRSSLKSLDFDFTVSATKVTVAECRTPEGDHPVCCVSLFREENFASV